MPALEDFAWMSGVLFLSFLPARRQEAKPIFMTKAISHERELQPQNNEKAPICSL
jgi:hypothetical protein